MRREIDRTTVRGYADNAVTRRSEPGVAGHFERSGMKRTDIRMPLTMYHFSCLHTLI